MPKAITDDERATILRLHGEGLSRNAIMREVGRSAGLVTNVVKGAGLTFERAPEVAVATEAKRIDNAARRAALEDRFLTEANNMLDQLHKPVVVYNFGGKDNTYAEHELDRPDIGGQHTLMRAAGTAVDKAVRLAQVDAATAGAQDGRDLVGRLFGALLDTVPNEESEPEQ